MHIGVKSLEEVALTGTERATVDFRKFRYPSQRLLSLFGAIRCLKELSLFDCLGFGSEFIVSPDLTPISLLMLETFFWV